MAKPQNNEHGYTLIELMIVITILTIMTSIILISFKPLSDTKTIDHFIEQLQEDIYYAQSLAISRKKTIKFQFYQSKHYYRIKGDVAEFFLKRSYSETITVEIGEGLDGLQFSFNRNGNVSQAGTLILETTKGKYRLRFQLGEGRFYVEKF